ncbi:hypothetical protein B9Q01_04495 [Candidatus Marsarchaeota G1 archaeon OSP_D]|jgi:Thiamine monophosphate kinase|uniref:Thiamine-monophosphate kinase n=2 Tax=Candidatus Marsarchaeota group 1 TaxID=2203770 RepID=A0A2R6AAR0_9ARCH|nr:MAG: hypothetical protein B9Q01_04495 [Candidatus Marsarchaeota G1 archaeon OSP_D]PSN88286.1 MAG: hypothetical protein B9Q00_06055 [Candidatus Marsarchaeota G1 archaeon OSP_C]
MQTLEKIGEEKIVQWLIKNIPSHGSNVLLGNGHDAAVIRLKGKYAFKTDTLVVTKMLNGVSLEDLGWKAVCACASDLATVGAKPLYSTISVCAPRTLLFKELKSLFYGIKQALSHIGAVLVGGDLSENPLISVSVNLLGEISGKYYGRTGSKPGDLIAVSREFGLEPLGLKILLKEIDITSEKLQKRSLHDFLRPLPEVDYGVVLGKLGFIHSCTDSSDSLAISIKNLIGSQLDAVIERLPTHPLLYTLDKKLVENLVLYGGEEYALVFTYDEKDDKRLKRALNKIGRDRIIIGRVKEGSGKILLKGKKTRVIKARGWRQFQSKS